MEHLLRPSMKEVLEKIKHFDYHITGSFALCALGKLDRPIKDLDIVSDDPRLIKYFKTHCMALDDVVAFPNQCRYFYKETLFVDVFVNTPISKKDVVKVTIGGYKLSLVKPEYIFINKLKMLDSINGNTKMSSKIISDLTQYFHLTYN